MANEDVGPGYRRRLSHVSELLREYRAREEGEEERRSMNSNSNDLTADRDEAINALRSRGVDQAEPLLEYATPAQILSACRRFDERTGIGPGLLAKWIRDGDFPAPAKSRAELLRQRFAEYAERFPEGSVTETHLRLLERRYPDDLRFMREVGDEPCSGDLIVIEAAFPLLSVECDGCGYTAALTPRSLPVLDG